jgi:hypothetical protein
VVGPTISTKFVFYIYIRTVLGQKPTYSTLIYSNTHGRTQRKDAVQADPVQELVGESRKSPLLLHPRLVSHQATDCTTMPEFVVSTTVFLIYKLEHIDCAAAPISFPITGPAKSEGKP